MHGLKSEGQIMASARNEAPKAPMGVGFGEGCPFPQRGRCLEPPPQNLVFDFSA